MRQKGDDQKMFRELLDRLSNGEFTKDDWLTLSKRELYAGKDISNEESEQFIKEGTMLCAYNKDLIEYNKKRLKALGTPIARIKSENSAAFVTKMPATKAQGLQSQMWLAKGAEVTLTCNSWKEAGLTNGARGIVKYIVYEGKTKPTSVPSLVIVEVPQYTGPGYLGMDKCVPIVPIKRDWYANKTKVWRRMIPLKIAYGKSIHSSQGASEKGRIIVNLGSKEFANGLTYVALSRVTKFENLSFYPMKSYQRFSAIKTSKVFKDRKLQDEREKQSDKEFL